MLWPPVPWPPVDGRHKEWDVDDMEGHNEDGFKEWVGAAVKRWIR